MKGAGLAVSWGTLLLGLEGPGKFLPVLTLKDVDSFATGLLKSSMDSDESVAVLVAVESGSEETHAVLRRLAAMENCSVERELRKWRVVLLKEAMSCLPSDPLYGLLALTEFWERFDYPPDSPHVVQGRGNAISPSDYYSEWNYRTLVQKHVEWIGAETAALRSLAAESPEAVGGKSTRTV